jgi:hypothetical protein
MACGLQAYPRQFQGKRCAPALRVSRLDRVGEPPENVATDPQAVHGHTEHRPVGQQDPLDSPLRLGRRPGAAVAEVDVLEGDRSTADEEPPEAPAAQCVDGGRHRIDVAVASARCAAGQRQR